MPAEQLAAGSLTPAAAPSSWNEPLRVIMVLPSLVRAGMETVTCRLAEELHALGHDVDLVCIEELGPLADEARARGVPVHLVPLPGLWTNVMPSPLIGWLRQREPQILHSHDGVWLKAGRAARRAGIPGTLHTMHGLLTVERSYSPLLRRLGAHYSSAIVTVSNSLRSYLHDRVGVKNSIIEVIPNGVDTERFHPAADGHREAVRGYDVGGPVIGCVARFDPVKRHDLLIRAFAIFHRNRPDAALVLVGDGPTRPDAEALVAELDLGKVVVFAGAADDTAPWYRAFDLFVLSSRAEGTSISILEAMASGCCIVATDVGGNGALLDEGRAGRLVPSGDDVAMAAAFSELLSDDSLARSFGTAARSRAVSRYSQRGMALAYVALYRKVLARRAAKRPARRTA